MLVGELRASCTRCTLLAARARAVARAYSATMAFIFKSFLDWLRSLFFKEEMELTLVGLQNSGKTTLVNVLAVRAP